MKTYTWMLAILLMVSPVWAQTPSDESIRELSKVMNINQQFDEFKKQSPKMAEAFVARIQLPEQQKLSETQKQQFKELIQKMISDSVVLSFDDAAFRQQLVDAWFQMVRTHLTQEEVDAMIDFYRTPVGASVLRKQSTMVADYMQTVMPMIMKQQGKIFQQNQPEFMAELKKILGKSAIPAQKSSVTKRKKH